MLNKILQFIASELSSLKSKKPILYKRYTLTDKVVKPYELKTYTTTKFPLIAGYTRLVVKVQPYGDYQSTIRVIGSTSKADGTVDITVLNQPRKTDSNSWMVGTFKGSFAVSVLYIPTEDVELN